MIGKKEYTNTIELQLLKKEKASLESKVFRHQKEQESLKEKIVFLEQEKDSLAKLIEKTEQSNIVNEIPFYDINLRSNIRDAYEFEEIENLALDILLNGQLQPVLITKDNYLISGHRRYFAFKTIIEQYDTLKINDSLIEKIKPKPDSLVTYKIERLSSEISDIELQELQYAENNERRSIDNFQLSALYNSYLEKGFDQKYLSGKFQKTKGNISSIVSLKKIDPVLVNYIKEFQIFAWSKKRFEEEVSSNFDEKKEQFFQNNKGIIGWKPLYEIAKNDSLIEQQKAFLNLFKNRLSKDELNLEYFAKIDNELANSINDEKIKKDINKSVKNLSNLFNKLDNVEPSYRDILKKNLLEIENIISKM